MRNSNIDFFRGIAAISVLFIHTVFQSGAFYVPEYMRSMSLILDVPVFIFISGFTFSFFVSYKKILYGILDTYKKYLFFIIIYSCIIFILRREQFSIINFLNWIFFSFPEANILPAVSGSIWFLPMFIKVSLICPLIITIVYKVCNDDKLKILLLLLNISLFLLLFSKYNEFILNEQILFYSSIYILGFLASQYKIKELKNLVMYLILNLIGMAILLYYYSYSFLDMQFLKFQYSLIYLLYSLNSILIFWFLNYKLKIKENIVSNIGKNAIWFYFAQGISSSICYFIAAMLEGFPWWITLLIVFIFNLIIAFGIFLILKSSYKYFDKFVKYLKDELSKCFVSI